MRSSTVLSLPPQLVFPGGSYTAQMGSLRLIYIGDVSMAILQATVTHDCHYLLALATLGKATEIEIILIAKVSNEGNITTRYCRQFHVQTSPM
jgi:hypothetical protein